MPVLGAQRVSQVVGAVLGPAQPEPADLKLVFPRDQLVHQEEARKVIGMFVCSDNDIDSATGRLVDVLDDLPDRFLPTLLRSVYTTIDQHVDGFAAAWESQQEAIAQALSIHPNRHAAIGRPQRPRLGSRRAATACRAWRAGAVQGTVPVRRTAFARPVGVYARLLSAARSMLT